MSIKNVITNNGIASASFNGKNYSRREVNGVVFYDITSSSSGATSGGTGGLGGFIDQQTAYTGGNWNMPSSGSFSDFDPDTQVVFAQAENLYVNGSSIGGGGSTNAIELKSDGTATTFYYLSNLIQVTLQPDGSFSCSCNFSLRFALTRFTRANVDGSSSSSSSSSSGGANVTTSDTMPASASDGDLWYDETNGGLYVYTDSINGWIQTNGGGGGGGALTVESVLRRDTSEGDSSLESIHTNWALFSRSNSFWRRTPTFTNDGSGVRRVHFRLQVNPGSSNNFGGEFWVVINGQTSQKIKQYNDSYAKNETALTTFWVNPGDEYYIEVQDNLLHGDDFVFWEETSFSSGAGGVSSGGGATRARISVYLEITVV